jgi:hypothetical protein
MSYYTCDDSLYYDNMVSNVILHMIPCNMLMSCYTCDDFL